MNLVLLLMSTPKATKYQVLFAITAGVTISNLDGVPREKKFSTPAPRSPSESAKPPPLLASSARMRCPVAALSVLRIQAVAVKLLVVPRFGKVAGSAT